MSDERDLETASGTRVLTAEDKEKLAEEMKEFEARQVSILSRSMVQDHLRVDLPDDLYGEWIPKDHVSIAEAQSRGFEIDTKYAPSQKAHLHSDGLNRATLGDTVFMVMPKWKKDIHERLARERFLATHGKRNEKVQAEEKNFLNEPDNKEIKKFSESSSTSVQLTKE